jgi:hypothetical protein
MASYRYRVRIRPAVVDELAMIAANAVQPPPVLTKPLQNVPDLHDCSSCSGSAARGAILSKLIRMWRSPASIIAPTAVIGRGWPKFDRKARRGIDGRCVEPVVRQPFFQEPVYWTGRLLLTRIIEGSRGNARLDVSRTATPIDNISTGDGVALHPFPECEYIGMRPKTSMNARKRRN